MEQPGVIRVGLELDATTARQAAHNLPVAAETLQIAGRGYLCAVLTYYGDDMAVEVPLARATVQQVARR
jgi:hypothetical protein